MFPFDKLHFNYKLELSHFELKGETYRFDFYNTTDNDISWKQGVDFLPEFDMVFEHTHITCLVEKKPYKDEEGKR